MNYKIHLKDDTNYHGNQLLEISPANIDNFIKISKNPNMNITIHREDGPAVYRTHDRNDDRYFIDGKELTLSQWEMHLTSKKLKIL